MSGWGKWSVKGHEKPPETRHKLSVGRGLGPLTIEGETLPLREWARRTGLPVWLISERRQMGWTPERCIAPRETQHWRERESTMSEARFWNYLREGMGSRWAAQRIENRVGKGIPDVLYAINGHFGMLELKFTVNEQPDPNRAQPCAYLIPEQRVWIRRFGEKAGYRAHLFWKISRSYYLFDSRQIDLIGHTPLHALEDVARYVWRGSICFDTLAAVL